MVTMVDQLSKIPLSCNIGINAEILESILEEEVVVGNYTQVLRSKLRKKVQLDRNNSILYSELGR